MKAVFGHLDIIPSKVNTLQAFYKDNISIL